MPRLDREIRGHCPHLTGLVETGEALTPLSGCKVPRSPNATCVPVSWMV